MKFFRENLSLKLASLALAIGVWGYFRGEDRPVQIFSAPLELRNLPAHLVVSGGVDETVNVRVRAPESVLRVVGRETLVATVDLDGLSEGEQTVRIQRESVRVPAGAEVVRVSPEFVRLRLDRKSRKDLAVNARIVGAPVEGFVVGEVRSLPSRATVEGPEGALAGALGVDTEAIRVSGRSKPFEAMVDLYPTHPDMKIIGTTQAQVSVDIHEKYATRTMSAVPVFGQGGDIEVRLDPPTVDVLLEGTAADLARITAADIRVIVDLSAVPPGQNRARLEPRIVFGSKEVESRVFVRGTTPEAVSVRVIRSSAP